MAEITKISKHRLNVVKIGPMFAEVGPNLDGSTKFETMVAMEVATKQNTRSNANVQLPQRLGPQGSVCSLAVAC